jgi:predicted lipid-binding transport protein (Tim44 family)
MLRVFGWRKIVAILLLTPFLQTTLPQYGAAQGWAQQVTEREHERAKAAQDAHDRRHHNTAKTVGGTAAGGALVGALAGGGKGALIGGAAGAGAGVVVDKIRKHHGVKKRERQETYRDRTYR